MKINVTESVHTALEAGNLMLELTIGKGKFHICNVEITQNSDNLIPILPNLIRNINLQSVNSTKIF